MRHRSHPHPTDRPLAAALALTLSIAGLAAADDPAAPTPAGEPPAASAEPAARSETRSKAGGVQPVDPEKIRAEKEQQLRQRFIPDPLDDGDLDELAKRLGLSEEARKGFAATRERYLAASAKAREDKGRELLRLLPAAYRYDAHETEFEPVYTPELLTALRLGRTIATAIAEAEAILERDLGQLCDAAHRGTWRRLRAARAETLYAVDTRLPGARVNLLELVPKSGIGEGELASLDLLFDRYAEEYVAALKDRHERLRSIEMGRTEGLVSLGPEWRAGRTVVEAQKVDREIAELDTAEVRSDIALRDLNAATVERIRKSLPPPAARRVLIAWQSLVHPELFEEERLFRSVMEGFLAVPGVQPEVRDAAIDRLVSIEDQLWPTGQQAVDLADSMVVAERLPPTDAAQVRIALEGQLHKLLMKRRKTVRDAVSSLVSAVPMEATAFHDRLSDTLMTFAAQDRASQFLMEQLASRDRELQMLLAMGETPATAAQDAPAEGTAEPTTVPVGEAAEGGTDGASESQPPANPQGPPSAGNAAPERRDARGSRRNAPRR